RGERSREPPRDLGRGTTLDGRQLEDAQVARAVLGAAQLVHAAPQRPRALADQQPLLGRRPGSAILAQRAAGVLLPHVAVVLRAAALLGAAGPHLIDDDVAHDALQERPELPLRPV